MRRSNLQLGLHIPSWEHVCPLLVATPVRPTARQHTDDDVLLLEVVVAVDVDDDVDVCVEGLVVVDEVVLVIVEELLDVDVVKVELLLVLEVVIVVVDVVEVVVVDVEVRVLLLLDELVVDDVKVLCKPRQGSTVAAERRLVCAKSPRSRWVP